MNGNEELTATTTRHDSPRTVSLILKPLAALMALCFVAFLLAHFLIRQPLFEASYELGPSVEAGSIQDISDVVDEGLVDEGPGAICPNKNCGGQDGCCDELIVRVKRIDKLSFRDVNQALNRCDDVIELAQAEGDDTVLAVVLLEKIFLNSLINGPAQSNVFAHPAIRAFPDDAPPELQLHFYSTLLGIECRRRDSISGDGIQLRDIYFEKCCQYASLCEDSELAACYRLSLTINHLEHLFTPPDSPEIVALESLLESDAATRECGDSEAALMMVRAYRQIEDESSGDNGELARESFLAAAETASCSGNLRLETVARKWAAMAGKGDRAFFKSQIETCLDCANELHSTTMMLDMTVHLMGQAVTQADYEKAIGYIEAVEAHSPSALTMSQRHFRFLRYAINAYKNTEGGDQQVAYYERLSKDATRPVYRPPPPIMVVAPTPKNPINGSEGSQIVSSSSGLAGLLAFAVIAFLAIGLISLLALLVARRNLGPLVVGDRFNPELDRQLAAYDRTERLGVMAGGIAHDMNNLMTGVMCNAELLQISAAGNNNKVDEQRSGQIIESVEIAAELSRQMLAFAGRQQLNCEPQCLNRYIEGLLPRLSAITGNQELIKTDFANDVEPVELDPVQFEKVIANLVVNSLEAADDKSSGIIIRTGRAASPEVSPEDEGTPPEMAFVEVEDFGKGIPEHEIDRIYDPFFTTGRKGKGLGLSLVFGVVKAHKGFCKTESTVGKGTTIRLYLPISNRSFVGSSKPSRPPEPASGGGLVLVVDDQEVVRTSTRFLLEVGGWSVVEAEDGFEAIEILKTRSAEIDCMIIDVIMPGMNGEDLLGELSTQGIAIPTVVMSGFSHQDLNSFMNYDQVVAVMQKPFPRHLLWLNMRKAFSAS